IKVVFSESGIGWVPYAIERADLVWERHRRDDTVNPMRPSDVWERNHSVGQIDERIGLNRVEELGTDKVMWELDFPHPDTVWPFAQEASEDVFNRASLDEAVVGQITR